MHMVLLTIGQRDVQLLRNTEESKSSNKYEYVPFDKKSLEKVQEKLWDLLKKGNLKWVPMTGREGENKVTETEIAGISVNICFPIIEPVLKYFQNRVQGKIKIKLLYTNRHTSGLNKKFIKEEPWFFAKIIKKFWQQVTLYYKVEAELDIVNICRGMKKNWDINTNFAFRQLDKIVRNIDEKEKEFAEIYLFSAAGIPKISTALEIILPGYFPKKVKFMNQNFGKITPSNQHKYQNRYSKKFSLIHNISEYEFYSAFDISLDVAERNSLLVHLLEAAKSWLYEGKKKAKLSIKKVLDNPDLPAALEPVLIKMKKMLSIENAVGCNLLRTIQETRSKNLWSITTLLISTTELFFLDKLEEWFPGSVVRKHYFFYIDFRKISLSWDLNTIHDKGFLSYKNKNHLKSSWDVYYYIMDLMLKKDSGKYGEFVEKIKSIDQARQTRNKFLHRGESISRKERNKALDFDSKLGEKDKFCNSKNFKYMAEELEKMNNIEFINWPPILQKIALKEAKKISPLL